uniref:ZP domain-containing protein n=1 Tax=Macrostomum lignano TaxID=282301 RepID=A0A1I8FW46_9PLAT
MSRFASLQLQILRLLPQLLLILRFCSKASAEIAQIQATKCSDGSGTWNLQLPVWPKLFSNSTSVEICLRNRMRESVERPTVGWADGVLHHLTEDNCVLLKVFQRAEVPALLMTGNWSCPRDNTHQTIGLTLSGSGFRQEISVAMRMRDDGCETVETISRQLEPDGSLESLVFSLCAPQPSNMLLLFEGSTRLVLNSLNKTGQYVRTANSEQVSFAAEDLANQLAQRVNMKYGMKPIQGRVQIDCHPPAGSRCSCYKLAVLLLILVAYGRPFARRISTPKILIVSLDAEVAAVSGQLAGLALPGLRLLLLEGHRISERSLRRALQRDSLAAARTFLLLGIEKALQAVDKVDDDEADQETAVARVGLDAWRMESARFSLLIYQPPTHAENAQPVCASHMPKTSMSH